MRDRLFQRGKCSAIGHKPGCGIGSVGHAGDRLPRLAGDAGQRGMPADIVVGRVMYFAGSISATEAAAPTCIPSMKRWRWRIEEAASMREATPSSSASIRSFNRMNSSMVATGNRAAGPTPSSRARSSAALILGAKAWDTATRLDCASKASFPSCCYKNLIRIPTDMPTGAIGPVGVHPFARTHLRPIRFHAARRFQCWRQRTTGRAALRKSIGAPDQHREL